jgi:predicted secreted protein
MGWISGIAVFFMIWWTVIFMVLPWGISRDERGIPQNARLKQKFIITTLLAMILWLGIYWMVKTGAIDFRGAADKMMQQDYGS